MNCLARKSRVLSRRLMMALVCYLFFDSGKEVFAAPVTLQFMADVVSVAELAQTDLPFAVEAGDLISGRLTFEPLDAQPAIIGNFVGESTTDTIQEFDFSIEIDSTVLVISNYVLQVRDNSPVIDETFTTDNIFLGPGQGDAIPGTDNVFAGFRMFLEASNLAIEGADISSSPEVWNQFTGFIKLNFQKMAAGDISTVLSIDAIVGDFQAVPEPSSHCMAGLFLIVYIFIRRSTALDI